MISARLHLIKQDSIALETTYFATIQSFASFKRRLSLKLLVYFFVAFIWLKLFAF